MDFAKEQLNVCFRRGANFTGTSIVHVKYARESADSYGQNVIMKWFDLISEFAIKFTCATVSYSIYVSYMYEISKQHW